MLGVFLPCPVSCGHTPSFGMLVMMTFRTFVEVRSVNTPNGLKLLAEISEAAGVEMRHADPHNAL